MQFYKSRPTVQIAQQAQGLFQRPVLAQLMVKAVKLEGIQNKSIIQIAIAHLRVADEHVNFPRLPLDRPPESNEAVHAVKGRHIQAHDDFFIQITRAIRRMGNIKGTQWIDKGQIQQLKQIVVLQSCGIQETAYHPCIGQQTGVVVDAPIFVLVGHIAVDDQRQGIIGTNVIIAKKPKIGACDG